MVKQSKKGKTGRRPTKVELAQQQTVKRVVWRVVALFFWVFTVLRLGVVGVTLYNLLRVVVGSTAYLLLLLGAVVLIFPASWWKKRGLGWGVFLFYLGLLLEYQAYLDWQYQGEDLFAQTLKWAVLDAKQLQVSTFLGGGILGAAVYLPISFLFSIVGSFVIGLLLLAMGVFYVGPWSVYDLADFLGLLQDKFRTIHQQRKDKRSLRAARKERLESKRETDDNPFVLAEVDEVDQVIISSQGYPVDEETGEILEEEPVAVPILSAYSQEEEFPVLLAGEEEEEEGDSEMEEELEFAMPSPISPRLAYTLPSIDLFAPIQPKNQSNEKKLVRQNIKILEETFASFGIKVVVERAEIGPSVTKYEVKPAVGVRVNRISNLADDLALALAAKDVRIEAPIPGKSLVGIEVPNAEVATVPFRELWEQSKTDASKLLEIPLGKAVNGSVRSFNLARMPHLLVAGSTGSGKSVAVNGIISSILMKASPDQVKFMMIDPKMVELSVYNDIPHLLIPVVTNPRKAAKALQKVVDEMEKRYEWFSQFGVRNLEGYNAKVEEWNRNTVEKHLPLPLIVVIVDELADLMMVASKEVEDAIIRLGQKARAAGIHMILATQRPSVDVISGLIKANVPSRIAFAVSSGTDSRTILDENGAEKLLGRGDMLFKPIDENHPIRLQGSFISDEDVEAIVSFIKHQAQADYDESFDPGEVSDSEADAGSSDNGSDPLFQEARSLVIETQKASASMIQRRLSVGFNRATRLMEELEIAGVIGPAEGTKPRKVLETQ